MERRKFVIGAGALATGSAAALGTGAFSAAQVSDRDVDIAVSGDDDALIQLIPGHEAEGVEDSTVTDNRVGWEDGQLFISFDDSDADGDGSGTGVNPNSVYQLGGIGSEGESELESFVDGNVSGPDVSDKVLYDTPIDDDPAFVIRNESNQDYDMTVSVEDDSSIDENEFTAAFAFKNGSGEGAFAAAKALGDDPEGYTNFNLGAGESLSVSLILVTENIDEGELDGSLHINAGEAVADENEP